MKAAIARHDRLVRTAIAEHGGRIFRTVGDSFCAAFAAAPAAFAAALAAQRVLHQEAWGDVGAVRVRMALHTGIAEEHEGDYVGATLTRAQQLLSSGHGGQTLLSATTAELIGHSLPSDVAVRDLGEHRLKDLTPPEHIYQVVSADLPARFPALRTIDQRPNNLPLQSTMLIGREGEVASVVDLLREPALQLVTITGPGGVGKTRIVLQAAAELVDEFADGLFFVSLAPLTDPSLVASTIGAALSLPEESTKSAVTLAESLGTQRLLLVLDTCERVRDVLPELLAALEAYPRGKLLTTSRASLRSQAGREVRIAPLAGPASSAGLLAERAGESPAVRLFVERARDVRPDFALTDQNAPVIAEICARLDGLPLAIELAATRSRLLPPVALLARLERRLPLLVGGSRELPARQQSLRDCLAWSYELLDEAEQILFRRLAVFDGGFTRDAADAVCRPGYPGSGDVLAALVDNGLLSAKREVDGATRYAMLETTHEYAAELLAATGEAADLQARHATWYLALAEKAEQATPSQAAGGALTRRSPSVATCSPRCAGSARPVTKREPSTSSRSWLC